MIIDTHTHLYLPEYDDDRRAVMERASEAGVRMMILPNVDLHTIAPMKALHAAYPGCTAMAMGLHPTEITESWQSDLAIIEHELRSGTPYVAIGEVGIDLYWDQSHAKEQIEALDAQLDWAMDMQLPVIIHCREGLPVILDLLRSRAGRIPQLIFHSFGGTQEDVAAIRKLCDPMFGINGIVTFRNSGLRSTIPSIGLDRLLIETDAPYLTPVPFRGKRNETAYITYTAALIAEIFQTTADQIHSVTSANAATVFALNIVNKLYQV